MHLTRDPWHAGMVGRLALVLLAALLLESLGNLALHRWAEREYVSEADIARLARHLATAERLAVITPPRHRARRIAALGEPGLRFNWVPRTVMTDVSATHEGLASMKARLVKAGPKLAERSIRLSILPSEQAQRRDLFGAMALADGSFVTFRVSPYLAAPPTLFFTMMAHLLLLGTVLLIALFMIRALVRPLRELADAADATQLGQPMMARVVGPSEVRRVAIAFTAMQRRLFQTMADHTQALIAVSHDLRTPIQRLRLRTALLDDSDARAAITDDLIEMERFIAATLAYIREDREEPDRLVDVAALVGTAVDNAADAGAAIVFRGAETLPARTRPTTLKRILGNVIENAVRHAERIEVTLQVTQSGFVIAVDDDGPGIPAERRAEALLPFRRLDADSRTGSGAGLGLALSVKAVAAMRGGLFLEDSKLGGLCVRIICPASA